MFYKGNGICFMKILGFSQIRNICAEKGKYPPGKKLTDKYVDSFVSKLSNAPRAKKLEPVDINTIFLQEPISLPQTKAETSLIKSLMPSEKYCIFLPGGTSNTTNYQDLYKSLSYNNINVLPVEYYGYGLNKNMQASYEKYIEVAEDAYKYLTDTLKVSPKNITIMGYCLGGWPACTLAKKFDHKALLLINPLTRLSEVSEGYITSKNVTEDFSLLEKLWTNTSFFKKKISSKFSSLKDLDQINCPVYIMSSKKDPVMASKFINIFKNKMAQQNENVTYLQDFETGHSLTKNKINIIANMLTGDIYKENSSFGFFNLY